MLPVKKNFSFLPKAYYISSPLSLFFFFDHSLVNTIISTWFLFSSNCPCSSLLWLFWSVLAQLNVQRQFQNVTRCTLSINHWICQLHSQTMAAIQQIPAVINQTLPTSPFSFHFRFKAIAFLLFYRLVWSELYIFTHARSNNRLVWPNGISSHRYWRFNCIVKIVRLWNKKKWANSQVFPFIFRNISQNLLTGTIPTQIGLMTTLQYLWEQKKKKNEMN